MSTDPKTRGARPLTGKHVLIIALSAFAVILAANLTMMFAATGTFPGLVVKNSYVAGVGWDARAAEQRALGWQAVAGHDGGALYVRITGADGRPVEGLAVEALVGRPASAAEDRTLALAAGADGYRAPVELAPGLWRIEITGSHSDGRSYRASTEIFLKPPAGSDS